MGRMKGAGFQISGVHVDDVARGDLGRPVGILASLGADAVALFDAFIAPDVDNLVQGADFGVPESGDGGILLAVGQRLGKGFLGLGDGAGLEVIGADFVDHGSLLLLAHGVLGSGLRRSQCSNGAEQGQPERETGHVAIMDGSSDETTGTGEE